MATVAVRAAATGSALHPWVLEQNAAAQSFHRARGATPAERCPCRPAGIPVAGIPVAGILVTGDPYKTPWLGRICLSKDVCPFWGRQACPNG